MDKLLKKKVGIVDPYLLQFFFPHFQFVSDTEQLIDYSQGVIYRGLVSDSTIKKLNILTEGKYIILSEFPEIVLNKPSDFISIFLPALEDKAKEYDKYELDEFLPLLKQYYILQKKIPVLKEEESEIYSFYKSTLMSKDTVIKTYISLLSKKPIHLISSSFFTFLLKVKNRLFTNCSPDYVKTINQANLKYGNKIKMVVSKYINSKQTEELAFLHLLLDLVR